MRKSKFTPEQILQALRQAESGTAVVDICHKLGVDAPVRRRLHELARDRPSFGAKRLHVLLRRDDLRINHKRVHQEGALALLRGEAAAQAPTAAAPCCDRAPRALGGD